MRLIVIIEPVFIFLEVCCLTPPGVLKMRFLVVDQLIDTIKRTLLFEVCFLNLLLEYTLSLYHILIIIVKQKQSRRICFYC